MCNHNTGSIGVKLNGSGKSEGYIVRTCVECGEDTLVHNPSKELEVSMKKFAKSLGIKLVQPPK